MDTLPSAVAGLGGMAALGALLAWILRRVRVSGVIRIVLGEDRPPE